jgi:hypothetical protein
MIYKGLGISEQMMNTYIYKDIRGCMSMSIRKIYKACLYPHTGDDTMVKNDKKDLKSKKVSKEVSSDEQIGFHKGSLSTLAKERQELARILQIIEQLMQMHVAALNELGVDLQKEVEQMKQAPPQQPGKKKPIEDVL